MTALRRPVTSATREAAIETRLERFETGSRTIVLLCYLGYLLSFADRVVFGLVLRPIKASLGFTDSQLGLLAGAAFAITYAVCSPLSGFLVDRFNRKTLLIVAIGFWSAMTFSTGLAVTFVGLAIVRGLVGAGEAFMHPLAISLIGSVVPQQRRARVLSFYLSAGAVGALLALLLGGLLLHLLNRSSLVALPGFGSIAPWRLTFFSAAIPGILLVLAILFFMREPARSSRMQSATAIDAQAAVFAKRYWLLFTVIFVGLAFSQLPAYTLSTWSIVFFGRVHGWTITRAAFESGVPTSIASLLGCLFAGRLVEAWRKRGVLDAPLRVGIWGGVLFAFFGTLGMIVPSAPLSAVLVALAGVFAYAPSVGVYAAMGDVLPPAVRGRFAGLSILALGIVANSLGPFVVGRLSDKVFRAGDGLRYALFATICGAAIVGAAFVLPTLARYRAVALETQEVQLEAQ